MAFSVQDIRFLCRGGLLAALKLATGSALRPLARELAIATDALSMRLGTGTGEYVDLSVLNPVAPSFQYKTETGSTADSDPGVGLFKWNHATQSSATFLYFDDQTSGTSTDLSTLFSSLSAASSGLIHIVLEEDRTKWQVWKWSAMTDGTGYWKFAVTLQASSASLGDNLPVRVTFSTIGGTYNDEAAQDAVAAMFAAGTHTGLSFSYNDAGNAISATTSGGGGMSHVASTTLGSAQTSITISGLDLSTDKEYRIQLFGENATSSAMNLLLYVNGDTTPANYTRQILTVNNTTVAGARATDAVVGSTSATLGANFNAKIEMMLDSDGAARASALFNRENVAQLRIDMTIWGKNAAANVTSITISSSVASALATGTTMRIFKITP